MRKFLIKIFSSKELYIRNQGSVKYFTLTPGMQISGLIISILLVLTLVASVTFISMQDEIIAFRNEKLQETVQSYEIQLAQMQSNIDSLDKKHQLTQEWFKEITSTLELRHNELTKIFEKNASVTAQLEEMKAKFAIASNRVVRSKSRTNIIASPIGNKSDQFQSRVDTGVNNTDKIILSDSYEINYNDFVSKQDLMDVPANIRDRVQRLTIRQQELLDALEENTDQKIAEATAIIDATETVNAEEFIASILPESSVASGGPFIPMVTDTNRADPKFKQMLRISNNLEKLSNLNLSLSQLPLSVPVHYYKTTSDFGPRIDPINKRRAFHAGLDFGAPSGTDVHATLPGRVLKAGNKGPYGLAVEIDHGNGFRTRYAHLKSIKVKRGQKIDFHQVIGTVGSTGRSTGPHLHYEIWYKDKVQNPMNFTQAGKHLFSSGLPSGQ